VSLPQASRRSLALLAAALLAALVGLGSYATGIWNGLEARTVDARFALRSAHSPSDLLVVGIDDRSIEDLKHAWPFPRSLHAAAIERLHADGARAIVYDVQFTERTTPRQDGALFDALRHVGQVVLATSEVNAAGQNDVLGGPANVTLARARVGAANLPADAGPVIRRYSATALGMPSLAVAGAEAALGHPLRVGGFSARGAWIDYRGPPGTIATVHFSDLVNGKVDPRLVAGRVVVVGATSPTLGDVHATSTTTGSPMSGPEVQASAIWTALHGNPLRSAPAWLAWMSIVLGALVAPLACRLGLRPLITVGGAIALAAGYLVAAQLLFVGGSVVTVVYPLVALAVGTVATVIAGYLAEAHERLRVARYAGVLEGRVRRGRRELRAAQLEVVERLTQAAESRDEQTGGHIQRIGVMCQRVALELGMSRSDAQLLRHASAMHDVGKIGIPDHVLLKPGPLDPAEWEIMKSHTTRGAAILAGSSAPLLQMAETIARTHHERWDGSGYPAALQGEDIPLVGRICAVCDVYDALIAVRPYKPAWPHEQAIAELRAQRGRHFDPRVLDAFLEVLGDVAASPASEAEQALARARSRRLTDAVSVSMSRARGADGAGSRERAAPRPAARGAAGGGRPGRVPDLPRTGAGSGS
jgi:HD-GYP domain-containing protein (c-di-GMP phosphodiesterase class II)